MLASAPGLMADSGNNTGSSSNSGSSNNNNNSSKPEKLEQKERYEFAILNQGPRERPRSVGYVDMNICGRTIVADCVGIGEATFEIFVTGRGLVQSMTINTVVEPRVVLGFPQQAGNYTFVVSSDNYYGEWDFAVDDNSGYVYLAFEL